MNRLLISYALSQIDEDLVAEAMGSRSRASERKHHMNQASEGRTLRLSRRIAVLALAACLLLALSITAYAAGWFGLRELFANDNRGEMSEEAAELIVAQDATIEGKAFRAQLLESYCDESSVLVTVSIKANEGYLLAPTDEEPTSPLRTIGLEGEGTLADYAAREGKSLLFVGASLDREELGLTSSGQRFVSVSPQEMTILIEAARGAKATAVDACTCTVYALAWSSEEQSADPAVEKRTLSVSLHEGRSALIGQYAAADLSAVPGIRLGELTLTNTPLGISLRLEFTVTDKEAAEQLLTVRLGGVEFYGNGRIDLDNGLAEFHQGRGEISKSPLLQFLDWDKNTVAEVMFEKIP